MSSHDRFSQMYDRQAAFQQTLYGNLEDFTDAERVDVAKNMATHLVSEAMEFMNELAWKAKRRQIAKIVPSNLLEESVDCIKMALTLPILFGFSSEEVFKAFMEKSDVVEQRYQQEYPLYEIIESGKPVVALDIDGVLADYPNCFYNWIVRRNNLMQFGGTYQYPFNPDTLDPIQAFHGMYSPVEMAALKDEYRQSGWKRHLPVIAGAVQFTHALRAKGYSIVLVTARPYKQYSRLFADTMVWLNENDFAFDAILWADNKECRLAEEFTQVAAFIDDDPANTERTAASGIRSFTLHRRYNNSNDTFASILEVL